LRTLPANPQHRGRNHPLMLTKLLGIVIVCLLSTQVLAADKKIPRLSNGKPDFSGIWQTTSAADYDLEPHSNRKDAPPGAGIVEGNFIPYLPKALEQKQKNFAARDILP